MPVMSVPAQQKPSAKRTGKRITFFNEQSIAMKETSQHPEGSYYVPGGTASDPGQSEAASTVTSNPEAPHMYLNSVIFSPDKGDQSRGHYQQTVPMKWAHQEPNQQQPSLAQQQRAASWNTMPNWGQNFANYIGGVNVTDSRTQNAFVKSMHETSGLQPHQQPPNRAADKPNPAAEAYRDAVKARGLDWEQQQSQAFQETLKPGALNTQQHSTSHPGGSSVLQPFQLAFGQPKQHLPAYYQTFQGNRTTLPNPPNYSTQAKPPHQLQQLQKQEQIQRQQQQQHHIIQQQIQQQHQQQMQQQQIIQHQQHVQQQLQQQQQIQHEQQQQKIQQQQQQQQQQLQIQQQMQHQQLQQQNPHVLDYYPGAQNAHPHPHPQPAVVHSQEPSAPAPPKIQEPIIQDITPEPQQPSDPLPPILQPETLSQSQLQTQSQTQLRRSRRLSKEGGAPSDNPFLSASSDQAAPGPQGSQNGARDIQAAPTGVIQSTRRKRRVSQEVNLETLAQKASEMESLPSQVLKEPHRPWSPTETGGLSTKRPRDDSLLPLVIPVSVPVRRQEASSPDRDEAALASNWPPRPSNPQDPNRPDHKPSVIVTRRRSLRNSLSESSEQNGRTEGEKDDDGKKSKRRPRPEPLFIPPPKPGLFIVPPVYSSITPYQSHLRSPVRLAENPLTIPPYTPPPILSPVREGSGLYFSTFLSSAAASGTALPPPATPKSATRSLLRSNSCDITPPVLSSMNEATPVSIEPRINIGSRYQAEVPELRQRSAVELDHHRAELVWAPLNELEEKPDFQQKVEDLMHLACSSVLCGGGTNQELAHHCLYECKGDIMAALSLLMLRNPVFNKSHHLANYHYSGSDSWTTAERRQFNKGITTFKKDFFMVQKQVTTKSVAQCVEFYYTYKKHVKIGRNGLLIYGELEPLEGKNAEEETEQKGSHRLEPQREEDSRKWEGSADRKQDAGPTRVTHTLPPAENPGTVLIMKGQEDAGTREQPLAWVTHPPQPPPPASKPRYESNARKTSPSTGNKGSAGPEGEFPCKKCGRIFYKVKSRSAHMKSHAEQEKKAAALRQKEAEERAAAKAAAEAAAVLAARQQNGTRQMGGDSTNDDTSDAEDEDDEDWQ
ncbi:mitotic deacetylase-associated SANT domain protein isoform X2 [Centropristis striata]|uniref:mitotic deacetylase-associated SANT domain protein isoform X2 n=1 Tax=Centropristis striata TaxID=184440 RepID=UPI0027E14F53|nr:mitotic deacetylase-associated SANT domain protein isoform X2 [Centropristis striata]